MSEDQFNSSNYVQVKDTGVNPQTHKITLEHEDQDKKTNLIEIEPITFKIVLKFAMSFYCKSIPLTIQRSSNFLQNIVGFILIGLKNDTALTAGFGVGNSCYLFFNYVLTVIASDCMSVFLSRFYGQKNWLQVRLSFWRGLFLSLVILLIGVAFFIRLDLVLLSINFNEAQSNIAHKMMLWLIPAQIVQAFTENMRNYVISLDIDRPMNWLNGAAFLTIPIASYPLMISADLDVVGFSLLRLIYELVNLIGLVIIIKKYLPDEAKVFDDLREVFKDGFCQFNVFFLKNVFGPYAEYQGFEAVTIMLGIMQQNDWMAAWVIINTISSLCYTFGQGFANAVRTIVNIEIGEGKNMQARRSALQSIGLIAIFDIILVVLFLFLKRYIAMIFTEAGTPLHELLTEFQFYYAFISFFDGILPVFSTIQRSVDKSVIYSINALINQFIVFDVLSAQGLWVFDQKALSVMYAFLMSAAIASTVNFILIISADWANVKAEELEVDDDLEMQLPNRNLTDVQIRKTSGVGESFDKRYVSIKSIKKSEVAEFESHLIDQEQYHN